jgi:Family of unknown function (DUF6869)
MQAPDEWWKAVLRTTGELTDEWSAEGIGRGPLRELIDTDPHWREAAVREARASPRFAAVLSFATDPAAMYEALGHVQVAEAYVRFADPDVPGWWDKWASDVFEYVLWQRPADEAWALLRRIVDHATAGGRAIEDIGNTLVTDFVAMWGEDFIDAIEQAAAEDPLFAEGLRSGLIHFDIEPETRRRLQALGLILMEA